MERVFNPRIRPFDEIADIAIAIRAVDVHQRHVGIVYRGDDGIKILHLAWHCTLRCESPSEQYLWVQPDVHPRRARQVTAICRQVIRANAAEGIPFAFSSPNDCFDPATFHFLLGPARLGLTCATFVLAVFERAGLPLAQYETWPRRADDTTWQQHIISMLEEELRRGNSHVTPEHIAGLRDELGAVRYRPEEIAAASTCPPATYRQVLLLALNIVELLNGQPITTPFRKAFRSALSAISQLRRRLSSIFRR